MVECGVTAVGLADGLSVCERAGPCGSGGKSRAPATATRELAVLADAAQGVHGLLRLLRLL